MEKKLISIGNRKAVILPKTLIEKYKLDKFTLHDLEGGILIKPVLSSEVTFLEKVQELQKNKKTIYARMKAQAEDPYTISYYERESVPEIDLDILGL